MEVWVFRHCLYNPLQYLIRLCLKLGEVCDTSKEMQVCLHFYVYVRKNVCTDVQLPVCVYVFTNSYYMYLLVYIYFYAFICLYMHM
jgi:hypothetical protein